jgi:hypothetical protein
MAKQTFTTGQVLTAEQMTSLQQTAMGGGSATAKTASYVLVAADAGATVIMNSASATTITVNTSLFSAGDTVFLQNIGAGVSTITAGTATVNTASSLALAQYESGNLYFTAAGTSIFSKADGAAAGGGGKVLQVVYAEYSTATTIADTSYQDSGLTGTITPTSATSKILVMANLTTAPSRNGDGQNISVQMLRSSTSIKDFGRVQGFYSPNLTNGESFYGRVDLSYLDSPTTTSATTYKIQGKCSLTVNSGNVTFQPNSSVSTFILMEIGA